MAETRKVSITNKAPGPRFVNANGSTTTLQKGETRNFDLTEADYNGMRVYFEIGHFVIDEAIDEEEPAGDIMPGFESLKEEPVAPRGDVVPTNETNDGDDDETDETDEEQGGPDSTDGELGDDARSSQNPVTHVEHRGFGRWYGMDANGERITEAMTETEAEAYAAEHGIAKAAQQDPSSEDAANAASQEADAAEAAKDAEAASDNTDVDENAGENQEA